MPWIRGTTGSGGGGSEEVVIGTWTQSSGAEKTISSSSGKSPKVLAIYNDTKKTGSNASGVFWSVSEQLGYSYRSRTTTATSAIGAATGTYTIVIKSIGSDSITVALPTWASYAGDTWKYYCLFD